MNRKRFSGALIALAALTILSVSPASAMRATFKAIGTSGSAGYMYWQPAPGGDLTGARLTGRFWRLGNRAAGNEGRCSVPTGGTSRWLYFAVPGPGIGVYIDLSASSCVVGCPSNRVVTVAENVKANGTGASFLAATVDETPAGLTTFDYTPQGNLQMKDIPRPQVTVASRVGNIANLSVTIASPAATATLSPTPTLCGLSAVDHEGLWFFGPFGGCRGAEPPCRLRLAEAQRMNMPARAASGEESNDGAV